LEDALRTTRSIWLCLILLGSIGSAPGAVQGSQPGEEFVGTWTGTWEGGGTGGFELTLEKGKDGAVTGKVSVTGEPTYKATIKTLSFDGKKMTAVYDFPPEPAIEVRLAATFEGAKATGTWSAREAGGGNELAAGTWTVARK
jgi:hypothetical protein